MFAAYVNFETFCFARAVIAQGAEVFKRSFMYMSNVFGEIVGAGEVFATFFASIRFIKRVSQCMTLHGVVTVERSLATMAFLANTRYTGPVGRMNDGVSFKFVRASEAFAAFLTEVLSLLFRRFLWRFCFDLRQKLNAVFFCDVGVEFTEAQIFSRAVVAAQHVIWTSFLVREELD